MNAWESFFQIFLLSIIPSVDVWIIIFLAFFVIAIVLAKTPGTVAALFAFILMSMIGDSFGGFYLGFKAMMWFSLGIVAVLAFRRVGGS